MRRAFPGRLCGLPDVMARALDPSSNERYVTNTFISGKPISLRMT